MEEKVAALIFRSTKYTCFDVLDYTKSLTPFHPCQQPTTTTILPTIFLPQFQLATTPCLTTPLTTNLSPSSQTPPTIETPKSLHDLESNTILYLSAIVSTLKFTLNSIFKSSQTLNNFPKTSQLNHSPRPKFIHLARPNFSDNQPIIVQKTYHLAMLVLIICSKETGEIRQGGF